MIIEFSWGPLVSMMRLDGVAAVWSCTKPHSSQDSQTTVLFEDGRKMTWWGVKDVKGDGDE